MSNYSWTQIQYYLSNRKNLAPFKLQIELLTEVFQKVHVDKTPFLMLRKSERGTEKILQSIKTYDNNTVSSHTVNNLSII